MEREFLRLEVLTRDRAPRVPILQWLDYGLEAFLAYAPANPLAL